MSQTLPGPLTQEPPNPPCAVPPKEVGITIISHSTLFYWWPVCLVGFVIALLTYMGGHRMAIVPAGTVAVPNQQVEGFEEPRDILVTPPGRHLPHKCGDAT
jgi:hypothetical protein